MEEELVGRMFMNLHHNVLAHAAFLDLPRSPNELINAVELIEETFSVLMERKRPNLVLPCPVGVVLVVCKHHIMSPLIGTPADVGIAAELAI